MKAVPLTKATPRRPGAWELFWADHGKTLRGLIGIVILLALWELSAAVGLVNPRFTSSPLRVVEGARILLANEPIWQHVGVSVSEILIGFALSALVGIPGGIVLGWYRRFAEYLDPIISAMYSTPRIALLPLIVIWFGLGLKAKVVIIFLSGVFPVLVNTITGVRTLDRSLLEAARSFGATDRKIFMTLALPSSVPYILSGLRLAAGRCVLGMVIAEFYAANVGIGFLLNMLGSSFQVDKVFFMIMVIAVFGIALVQVLERLESRFDYWRPGA